ncbi:MAG: IPExxxVDY family protein [Bacteroidetes bacterium]|nr:IPExxxVDY family protein [Bacteroidota bacterium]
MAPKKKLLIHNDYDFFLFGISCGEKPYRLCWALNNQLKATFAKDKDMEVQEKNQTTQTKFPMFAFRNEAMFTDYRIILNKAENKFLVPEFKQADYLLMVQGSIPSVEKNSILKKVKDVTFVQTAFEIDPKKIKSKENFVF